MQVNSQKMIKAYNKKAPQQNVIKHMDTKKIIFYQIFTYPYSSTLDDTFIEPIECQTQ